MQKMHTSYAKLTIVTQESANVKNESCYAILTYQTCKKCIADSFCREWLIRSCGYTSQCDSSIGFTSQANICYESLYFSNTIPIPLSTILLCYWQHIQICESLPESVVRNESRTNHENQTNQERIVKWERIRNESGKRNESWTVIFLPQTPSSGN